MLITYKSKRAEEQFSSSFQKRWRYPEQVKTKLKALENFIQSAVSLQDIINFPSFHFHHLEGNRKGEWAVYLGHTGYRVTLIPCDKEGKEIFGKAMVSECRMITIVEITEVNNHYE